MWSDRPQVIDLVKRKTDLNPDTCSPSGHVLILHFLSLGTPFALPVFGNSFRRMVPLSSKQHSYGHFVYLTQWIKTFVFKKQNSTFFSMEKSCLCQQTNKKRKGKEKKEWKKKKKRGKKERKGKKGGRGLGDWWTERVSKKALHINLSHQTEFQPAFQILFTTITPTHPKLQLNWSSWDYMEDKKLKTNWFLYWSFILQLCKIHSLLLVAFDRVHCIFNIDYHLTCE